MNYELAKELKDAGFPQETHFYYDEDGHVGCEGDKRGGLIRTALCVGAPSLSELIEACGERFDRVGRNSLGINDSAWEAVDNRNYVDFGDTPEEAVARLWLALNKK